tara:strand:- start:229 stop:465 length:237 start_codon:yes stop_codon:yes gene_type:complete
MNKMEDIEFIKEYALKHYKRHFIKKYTVVEHSVRGKVIKTKSKELPILISIEDNHIQIKNNKDASPIILSKNILNERI